eukprot:351317-Chlamydomonas_euryale.AAC.3
MQLSRARGRCPQCSMRAPQVRRFLHGGCVSNVHATMRLGWASGRVESSVGSRFAVSLSLPDLSSVSFHISACSFQAAKRTIRFRWISKAPALPQARLASSSLGMRVTTGSRLQESDVGSEDGDFARFRSPWQRRGRGAGGLQGVDPAPFKAHARSGRGGSGACAGVLTNIITVDDERQQLVDLAHRLRTPPGYPGQLPPTKPSPPFRGALCRTRSIAARVQAH